MMLTGIRMANKLAV